MFQGSKHSTCTVVSHTILTSNLKISVAVHIIASLVPRPLPFFFFFFFDLCSFTCVNTKRRTKMGMRLHISVLIVQLSSYIVVE